MPFSRQANSWMVDLRRPWRRRGRGSPAAAVPSDRRGWPGLRPAM